MTPQLRVPPHSVEAEQSVLGALLLDSAEAFDAVGALLRPADFYRHEHRLVFEAVTMLAMAGKPADVVTVFERLQAAGRDGDVGGLEYLNALAQSVPSARNAQRYAEIVRDRAMRREVIAVADGAAAEAFRMAGDTGSGVNALIDRAVQQLLTLQAGGASGEPRDLEACLPEFLDDLEARAAGKVLTFRTGLDDLDRLTGGGGRRGELWVFGARPSMGKTALVLQLCRKVGAQHQGLLLSQEDSILSAVSRFVAAAGAVNLADIRNPRADHHSMWTGVAEGIDEIRPLALAIDDQTGLGLADVRRKAQQVRRRCRRLDFIVVDYLQLMDDAGDNRNQSLGMIANGLKRLAKELGCWIVLLSQLNREADKRKGVPQMSDLRDSGDIEGAADLIGLLHREHQRDPTEDNKHWAQLHVAKQKNGPTDTLSLYFDGALQRFGNWEGAPPRRGKGS